MNLRDDEVVIQLTKKIKFKSLHEITNEEEFDPVNQVQDNKYNYSSAKRQFQIKLLAVSITS